MVGRASDRSAFYIHFHDCRSAVPVNVRVATRPSATATPDLHMRPGYSKIYADSIWMFIQCLSTRLSVHDSSETYIQMRQRGRDGQVQAGETELIVGCSKYSNDRAFLLTLMASQSKPPFYVLIAQAPVSNLPAGALSNNLSHPVIQYHYADDSPLSVIPSHPDEQVLVMNYDRSSKQPTVQSISTGLSVTGLRLEEAPGAALADPSGTRNDTMYIIETTSDDP